MKTKRALVFITVLLTLFCVSQGIAAAPAVNATSAAVIDGDTGVIYFEKNADQQRHPASMTKLITTYIVFEEIAAGRLSFDSPVTISTHSAAVAATPGLSNVPLRAGEQFTVDTLLKVVLLPSACGATVALAEKVSGSEAAFCQRMTNTLRDLGLDAQFLNAYGGQQSGHYVTARSMATLAAHFVAKHPGILRYTSLQTVTFKGVTYKNTNKFLGGGYGGADGLKTGTSVAAGPCITVSALRNGKRIIAVVMNSGDRYGDAQKLLDYGFSAAANANAQAATIRIDSKRDDVRLKADLAVTATVTAANQGIYAAPTWQIDGTTVKKENPRFIGPGMSFTASFDLDAYATDDVAITFCLTGFNAVAASATRAYAFSAEEPCAFRDIDKLWAEADITRMAADNAVSGYPDGYFYPQRQITRAEFTTILCRMLESHRALIVAGDTGDFSDSRGHWAEKYIAAAAKAGIVEGVSADRFAPNEPVTRQEMATLIYRAFDLGATQPTKAFLSFSDGDAIAAWAQDAVARCSAEEILRGYPDGSFGPQKNATRAEATTVLARCLPLLQKEQTEDDPLPPPTENTGDDDADANNQ